jgi:response regulator RpfG family c-di-GMP phosphodiesterase
MLLVHSIDSIAVVSDSLFSIRSYKDRMSHDEAISIMRSKSGSHFDPSMIDILLLEQEKFREISNAMGEQPS